MAGANYVTIVAYRRLPIFVGIVNGTVRLNAFGETCPRESLSPQFLAGMHRFPELWEPVRLRSGGCARGMDKNIRRMPSPGGGTAGNRIGRFRGHAKSFPRDCYYQGIRW
jgi:hypothetical protein